MRDPNARASRVFTCGPAARWMPRVLAASVLIAAVTAAFRLDPGRRVEASEYMSALVAAAGFLVAFWIVRGGSEVRCSVSLEEASLEIAAGGHAVSVSYESVSEIDWEPAMLSLSQWLPATVLVSSDERRARICALLRDGDELVRELLRRTGRADVASWADARRIEARMRGAGIRVAAGYVAAAAVLAGAILLHSR